MASSPGRSKKVSIRSLAWNYASRAGDNGHIIDAMLKAFPLQEGRFSPEWGAFFRELDGFINNSTKYQVVKEGIYKKAGIEITANHPPK